MATITIPPITEMQGFNMSQGDGDPIEIVLDFCERVPQMLRQIFQNESFELILREYTERTKISPALFFNALQQAENELFSSLSAIKEKITSEFGFRAALLGQLKQTGFTGSSLELKANLLDFHIQRAARVTTRWNRGIVNLLLTPIIKVIRRLLGLLNDLLDSLKFIPGIDGIKELKDIGEKTLDVVDDEP